MSGATTSTANVNGVLLGLRSMLQEKREVEQQITGLQERLRDIEDAIQAVKVLVDGHALAADAPPTPATAAPPAPPPGPSPRRPPVAPTSPAPPPSRAAATADSVADYDTPMAYLQAHPGASLSEMLRALGGVKRATVRRHLQALRRRNRVHVVGKARGARWFPRTGATRTGIRDGLARRRRTVKRGWERVESEGDPMTETVDVHDDFRAARACPDCGGAVVQFERPDGSPVLLSTARPAVLAYRPCPEPGCTKHGIATVAASERHACGELPVCADQQTAEAVA